MFHLVFLQRSDCSNTCFKRHGVLHKWRKATCVEGKKELHAGIYQMLEVELEIDMEPQCLRVIVTIEVFIKQRDFKYDFAESKCRRHRGL